MGKRAKYNLFVIIIFGFAIISIQSLQALPNIILFGPPGSGKNTIATLLAAKYQTCHISSGDLVRKEVAAGTDFGKRVAEFTDKHKGSLLPDAPEFMGEVFRLVKERLLSPLCKSGYILDGIPRNISQAHILHQMLEEIGLPADLAAELSAKDETLIERIKGRLNCASCGYTFHRKTMPPKVAGKCDQCSEVLVERDDDLEVEVIKDRIKIYNKEFSPIVEFYRSKGILSSFESESGSDIIFKSLTSKLDEVYNSYQVTSRHYLKRKISTYAHPKIPELRMYNLVEMYKDPELIQYVVEKFAERIRKLNPDYIAAPEARALPIFGALIAATGKPGIFIRKAGKLPAAAPKYSVEYKTAYSDDSIEMTADSKLKGKTVLFIDDGISSGGTTTAGIQLLEKAGMKPVHVLAVIRYHYRDLCSEFLAKGLLPMTTTLFDL